MRVVRKGIRTGENLWEHIGKAADDVLFPRSDSGFGLTMTTWAQFTTAKLGGTSPILWPGAARRHGNCRGCREGIHSDHKDENSGEYPFLNRSVDNCRMNTSDTVLSSLPPLPQASEVLRLLGTMSRALHSSQWSASLSFRASLATLGIGADLKTAADFA